MQCVINLGFGEKKIQGHVEKIKTVKIFLVILGGGLGKDTIGILWVEA